MRSILRRGAFCFFLAQFTAGASLAQSMPADPAERECWQRHTAERTKLPFTGATAVQFGNLRNGDTVYSPFRVDFTTRGIGIAPAGKALPKTGHHHLLVDTPLPLIPTDRIPFSEKHVHFGKGQISTVLDLKPGSHTLQLLFADHEHRPYYVFSPRITVEVRATNDDGPPRVDRADFERTCRIWYQYVQTRPRPPGESLFFANVRDQEPVRSPFTVAFGVVGVAIGAKAASVPGTGHFALEVKSEGRPASVTGLSSGATQMDLDLPAGKHALKLRFIDSVTGADRLPPREISLFVVS